MKTKIKELKDGAFVVSGAFDSTADYFKKPEQQQKGKVNIMKGKKWTQYELDMAYSRYIIADKKARDLPYWSDDRKEAKDISDVLSKEWCDMCNENDSAKET
jgi:hypothetical protein